MHSPLSESAIARLEFMRDFWVHEAEANPEGSIYDPAHLQHFDIAELNEIAISVAYHEVKRRQRVRMGSDPQSVP